MAYFVIHCWASLVFANKKVGSVPMDAEACVSSQRLKNR